VVAVQGPGPQLRVSRQVGPVGQEMARVLLGPPGVVDVAQVDDVAISARGGFELHSHLPADVDGAFQSGDPVTDDDQTSIVGDLDCFSRTVGEGRLSVQKPDSLGDLDGDPAKVTGPEGAVKVDAGAQLPPAELGTAGIRADNLVED